MNLGKFSARMSSRALLDDQRVDGDQIGGGESQLGEEQVDPV